MKRSEMLKIISSTLKSWEDCKLGPKAATDILETIEANGMMPPPKHIVKVEEIDGQYIIKLWDWEPENDKRKSHKRRKPSP